MKKMESLKLEKFKKVKIENLTTIHGGKGRTRNSQLHPTSTGDDIIGTKPMADGFGDTYVKYYYG